jgi:hypothetical protein
MLSDLCKVSVKRACFPEYAWNDVFLKRKLRG